MHVIIKPSTAKPPILELLYFVWSPPCHVKTCLDIYIPEDPCWHIDQKKQCGQNKAASPLTLNFGDICRYLSEIHRILSEIEETLQESMIWKARMRVMMAICNSKIVANRDASSFCHLKL